MSTMYTAHLKLLNLVIYEGQKVSNSPGNFLYPSVVSCPLN